jgi:uncharacterized protein YeaO (DUF488 family)
VPAPTSSTTRPQSKSVYDSAEPADGRRVLVTQYWPRGVPRAAVDEYVRALAPTRELLHAFKDGAIDWGTFRKRYREEMNAPPAQAEIARLAERAASEPVTLLCVCREESSCHRSLLRELIAKTGPREE